MPNVNHATELPIYKWCQIKVGSSENSLDSILMEGVGTESGVRVILPNEENFESNN